MLKQKMQLSEWFKIVKIFGYLHEDEERTISKMIKHKNYDAVYEFIRNGERKKKYEQRR